jgi:hypothetical protein
LEKQEDEAMKYQDASSRLAQYRKEIAVLRKKILVVQ